MDWRRGCAALAAKARVGRRRLFRAALALVLLWAPGGRAEAPMEGTLVASIAPLHGILSAVALGVGEPQLLISPERSPHGEALQPSQARRLRASRLFVWVGPALEGLSRDQVRALAGGRVVELLAYSGWTAADEEGVDPHLWLHPDNARRIAELLAEELSRLDPAHSARYRRNAERFGARVRALESELSELLRPVRERGFLTLHPAFRYLARAFGLRDLGALLPVPEAAASPGRLARLARRAREERARCLFLEPQAPEELARRFADQLGLALGRLDPLGAAVPAGPEHYFGLMRANARALLRCLGGDERGR